MTPRDTYRRARVQHYLDRAREYLASSRYTAAQQMIQAASKLDPANKQCGSMLAELQQVKSAIAHPTGGGAKTLERRRAGIVLIVDQDERVLSSLSECLRRYGYATIGAGTYEEALEILSSVVPDAVVSEVNFESGPRGFDLYTHVKTNGYALDIPFVFLTTRLDKDMLIAGKRFGVDDFLLKPVDADVVAASIASCISRHRHRN